MEDISTYFTNSKNPPEAPDEFLFWQSITVKGDALIAKDAIIMHTPDEAIEDWVYVSITPGIYDLTVKLYRDDDQFNRVGLYRACLKDSNPVRGNKVGDVEVDHAIVGICDYKPYIETIRRYEDDYEEYADELFDLMEHIYAVAEFKGENVYYVMSGCGDGMFPVYALESDGKVVGIKCDFRPDKEDG